MGEVQRVLGFLGIYVIGSFVHVLLVVAIVLFLTTLRRSSINGQARLRNRLDCQ